MRTLILLLAIVSFTACAGKKPLDRFTDVQEKKIVSDDAFNGADFDFWAAVYEPTLEDLERLRAAWVEHGAAFPESKAFAEIERALMKSSQKVVLVALYMTEYDKADLKDASLGWAISPIPQSTSELLETDVVIRTLMPVDNDWARYFLVRYTPEALSAVDSFIVSNRTSSVRLKR